MTAKTKQPVIYGDDLPITAFQIKRIRQNCNFDEDIKEEWVQWVTGDINCTSLKSLTQAQAVKIIRQQTGEPQPKEKAINFGTFDLKNPKHIVILSLVRQNQWIKQHPRHGEVADMDNAFASWLQSSKCPVKKPLMDMNDDETEKIIKALGGMIISKYKKR